MEQQLSLEAYEKFFNSVVEDSTNPEVDLYVLKVLNDLGENQGISKSKILKKLPTSANSIYQMYEAIGRLSVLKLIDIKKDKYKHMVAITPLGRAIMINYGNCYLQARPQ